MATFSLREKGREWGTPPDSASLPASQLGSHKVGIGRVQQP